MLNLQDRCSAAQHVSLHTSDIQDGSHKDSPYSTRIPKLTGKLEAPNQRIAFLQGDHRKLARTAEQLRLSRQRAYLDEAELDSLRRRGRPHQTFEYRGCEFSIDQLAALAGIRPRDMWRRIKKWGLAGAVEGARPARSGWIEIEPDIEPIA